MINWYKNLKSPKAFHSTTIEKVLQIIKEGNEFLPAIIRARNFYNNDKKEYDKVKTHDLPCYTLNFEFDGGRSKNDIKNSTGYIYIDVDGETDFDYEQDLVYASWLSLSGNGRGLLVKAEGVTCNNFKYTYEELSHVLDIRTDKYAAKPTQPNVLSYDPSIYINADSVAWNTSTTIKVDEKNTHYSYTIKKEKEERKDITVLGRNNTLLRFNTLDEIIEDIDFDGELFKDFPDKLQYAEAFLPFGKITEGGRNNVIYSFARQIRAVNPYINATRLYSFIDYVNKKKCIPVLGENEITLIVRNVMNIPDNELNPFYNKKRRFFFNPDYELSGKKRKQLTIGVINNERKEKSIQSIRIAVDNWDYKNEGKITQEKLAKRCPLNIKTVQNHYYLFKEEIKQLNKDYKSRQNNKARNNK